MGALTRPRQRRDRRPEPLPAVEVRIARLGAAGDGIADGAPTLYVPLTAPGDRVLVRPGAERGGGRAADLVELLEPGPHRVPPACPHFGRCGGCALQHLNDRAYEAAKRAQLDDTLRRAGAADVEILPLLRVPPGGRRRVTLAAERRGGAVTLGYHARRSHALVDVGTCPIADAAIQALIAPLRQCLVDVLVERGTMAALVTRLDDGIDLLLQGPLPPGPAVLEHLASFAQQQHLARLSWRSSEAAAAEPVSHRRSGIVRFGAASVSPPPGAFLQASPAAEQAMVRFAQDALAGVASIADLFAGCGTFALPLSPMAPVHAVEGDAALVRAMAAAAQAIRARLVAESRDLFRQPLGSRELNRFDAVLFDPPRAGAAAQCAELAKSEVSRVVAISCNPATFARDARTLIAGGFRLRRVLPVDQFLWSAHLELAAEFVR